MLLSENSYVFRNRKQLALWAVFFFFAVVYCAISLVNHYLFRTYALDLGMFNHALYDFSYFRANYFTLSEMPVEINYFGAHFSPIIVLFAPLRYLFGTYTLLVIQIASILFGGYGIYKYAKENAKFKLLPFIILIHFFGIWGIYSALSYDYHDNVVAAMMVPWFIYFFEKNNKIYAVLFFVLILIAKENMALWMFFILLGLLIKNKFRNIKKEPVFTLTLLFVSVSYFLVVITFIMPELNKGLSQLARYQALGETIPEIIISVFKRPAYAFSLLFESTLQDEIFANIKMELHFMVFVSGGVALLFAPHYLLMLLPIYAQKMFSDNYGLWGINAQYSIEFVPILSLALFDVANRFSRPVYAYMMALLFVFTTYYFNYKKTEHRHSLWYDPAHTKLYSKAHYSSGLNTREIYKALKLIPENAVLSAHSALAPHLAFRDRIYHFPTVHDAEYIAVFVDDQKGYYPFSKEVFIETIENLEKEEGFVRVYDANKLLIMKKR